MESATQAISCTEKKHVMTISYHELAGISKQKAREIVRKVLHKNERNVSKTASILGRRNAVAKKKVRTKGGTRRHLYEYEHL